MRYKNAFNFHVKTMGVIGFDFSCWNRGSGPRKLGWSR